MTDFAFSSRREGLTRFSKFLRIYSMSAAWPSSIQRARARMWVLSIGSAEVIPAR